MKIEIEIDQEKLNAALIEKLAEQIYWSLAHEDGIKDKIMKSINWSKMTPIVQERILKLAAEKAFK